MLDEKIQKAFDSKRNLFLTGPAGTGKSFALREYIATHENVLVCAPTGIAALNLNGDTMHRLFHIPVPAYESPSFASGNKKAVPNSVLKTLSLADCIIIDEVSMARADVFRYAIKVLRKAEKLKGSKIRVIASGDFSQLPPVLKRSDGKLLAKAGFDPSGFAFTTDEWKSLNFQVLELTKIYRQDDIEFIERLNEIRVGNFENLSYFDRFVSDDLTGFDDAIHVCGTNAEVDEKNRAYLDSLPGLPSAYMAEKSGRVPAGMIDELILLKPDARVIFTVNDNIHDCYRNGSFGRVVSLDNSSIIVEVDGNSFRLFKKTWPVNSYAVQGGKLVTKELGSVTQLPLKLAKAITIHRSQGQTFDKIIISPDVFAPGQLYVALSRVRTPDGLRLTRQIKPEDLILDPVVQKFYDDGYMWTAAPVVKKKPVSTARKSAVKTKSRSGTAKVKSKTAAAKSKKASAARTKSPSKKKDV